MAPQQEILIILQIFGNVKQNITFQDALYVTDILWVILSNWFNQGLEECNIKFKCQHTNLFVG